MCNRYRAIGREVLIEYARREFGIEWDIPAPRYNIAPNQTAAIFRPDGEGKLVADMALWNLIPAFERDNPPKYLRTNARSEEVLAKPSYRSAIQKRRVLVPADGFYEWEHVDGGRVKLPWAFERFDGKPFCFAGIAEPPSDQRPASFAILTTSPNELVGRIHNRMPVLLSDQAAHRWVAPGPLTTETLAPFVAPFPPAEMRSYRVNPLLNSVRNDTSEAAARVNTDEPVRSEQTDLFT